MKIYYLFLISFLLISCSPKEIPSNQLNERNNLYYEINSEIPFSGATLEYYPNGQIKYKKNYSEGKLYGLSERFYPNGQLEYQKNYKDKVLHGLYKTYSKYGELEDSRIYENNEGIETSYYNTGELFQNAVYLGEVRESYQTFFKSGSLSEEMKKIKNPHTDIRTLYIRLTKTFYETGELRSEGREWLYTDIATTIIYDKDGTILEIFKQGDNHKGQNYIYTQKFLNSVLQEEICLYYLTPGAISNCDHLIAREY